MPAAGLFRLAQQCHIRLLFLCLAHALCLYLPQPAGQYALLVLLGGWDVAEPAI